MAWCRHQSGVPDHEPGQSGLQGVTLLGWVLGLMVTTAALLGGCDARDHLLGAGDNAPGFRLPAQSGQPLSFPGDLQGQVVVLLFWADWCSYCRAELPDICERLVASADQGLAVLAINAGQSRQVVDAFLQDTPIACRVLLDTDSSVSNRYGATFLPMAYVIDRKGVIRQRILGRARPSVIGQILAEVL
jgi:cytochrome c biogenesis protein CcmG/thiol:disulfide interchange protein DsbE